MSTSYQRDDSPSRWSQICRQSPVNGATGSTHQLPVEILVDVFQRYITTNIVLPSKNDPNTRFFKPEEVITEPTNVSQHWHRNLYLLRRVSRRWTRAIDCSPSLWAFVHSLDPPNVINNALSKSKGHKLLVHDAPARITIGRPPLLPSVTSHVHRWNAVRLQLTTDSDFQALENAAPKLQKVDLTFSRKGRKEQAPMDPIDLFGGAAESLLHVKLQEVNARWDSPIFTGLHSLSLLKVNASIVEVLRILALSPDIRYLVLGDLRIRDPAKDLPTIQLSHLERIRIQELDGEDLVDLVAHIVAPKCESFVASTRQARRAVDTPVGPRLKSSLFQAVPNVITSPSTTEVSWTNWEFDFKVHSAEVTPIPFHLQLNEWTPVADLASWLSERCGHPPMTIFTMSVVQPKMYDAQTLLAFDAVEEIHSLGAIGISHLLRVISKPTADGAWLLPKLKKIRLSHECDLEILSAMVKQRYSKNAKRRLCPPPARLQRLELDNIFEYDGTVLFRLREILGEDVVCWSDSFPHEPVFGQPPTMKVDSFAQRLQVM